MLTADRIIAGAIMALSLYFMWYAIELPIGWNGETGGPGGGAFPFWLSFIMLICAGVVLAKSFAEDAKASFHFDVTMLRPILLVVGALCITVFLIPIIGTYLALPIFLFWYLKIFGKHSWLLSLSITLITPVALFFFFEATLRILLPKGLTEPLFFPLYSLIF